MRTGIAVLSFGELRSDRERLWACCNSPRSTLLRNSSQIDKSYKYYIFSIIKEKIKKITLKIPNFKKELSHDEKRLFADGIRRLGGGFGIRRSDEMRLKSYRPHIDDQSKLYLHQRQ